MNAAIEKLMASPVEHLGYRVITLAMMDEAHGRKPGHAGRAFRQYRDRLVEGRHYFRGCGEILRAPSGAGSDVLRRTSSGRGDDVLLTERGYLLLVKTFHDDLAWQVQETLVEGYFRARSARLDPFQELVLRRLDSIEANQWGFQHAFNSAITARVADLERGQRRLRAGVRQGLFGSQGGRGSKTRSSASKRQLTLAGTPPAPSPDPAEEGRTP